MASVTLTVSKVRVIGGTAYVRWSDGVEQEFDSLSAAKDYAHDVDSLRDALRLLAIARYLRVDPTGANPALIEGHSITGTDDANAMVTVV